MCSSAFFLFWWDVCSPQSPLINLKITLVHNERICRSCCSSHCVALYLMLSSHLDLFLFLSWGWLQTIPRETRTSLSLSLSLCTVSCGERPIICSTHTASIACSQDEQLHAVCNEYRKPFSDAYIESGDIQSIVCRLTEHVRTSNPVRQCPRQKHGREERKPHHRSPRVCTHTHNGN